MNIHTFKTALLALVALSIPSAFAQTATPHTLQASAAAQSTPANPELLYRAIPLCRLFSTGTIAAGTSRDIFVSGSGSQFAAQGGTAGGCGIPTSATAVSLSLSAYNGTGNGALVAYAQGSTKPSPGRMTSFQPNLQSTGAAIVPVANNQITVSTINYSAQVFGEVTGYFIPQIAAQINSDGSVQTSTSRIISVTKGGTGLFYIDIDRDVRSCTPLATPYNVFRYASVGYSSSDTPNRLSVYIWYISNGTPTLIDYPFMFHVVC